MHTLKRASLGVNANTYTSTNNVMALMTTRFDIRTIVADGRGIGVSGPYKYPSYLTVKRRKSSTCAKIA